MGTCFSRKGEPSQDSPSWRLLARQIPPPQAQFPSALAWPSASCASSLLVPNRAVQALRRPLSPLFFILPWKEGPFLGSRIRLPSALRQSQSQNVIRARLLNPNPQPQTAQTTRFGSPAPTFSSVKLSGTVRSSISCRLAMLVVVVVVVVRWIRLRHVAARLAGVNSLWSAPSSQQPHRIHHSLADGTMGTNTSSPASYVDQGTSMSGLARMGGAQPRNKTPKAAPSPPAQSKAKPDRAQADRPSIDTLPPYQAPHTQHRP
ncbi:hypothetical protein PaG_05355 [Moesziomyces aphidis]|uniref:Uncharacterized protein n=1 Tax=Moesziomyces aphidis TaxID=84754 RepID=W3VID9_MOEAP|nr:hypothetical protein PaG_05355 [Moesziomyces aphidis]